MTREEAIVYMTFYKRRLEASVSSDMDEDIEAFDMAIKALEQQPCEDAVSRQAVLDQAVDYGSNTYLIPVNSVKTLPPVTPKEKTATWVPTDEEPHEDYECNKCGYVVSTFTANIEPHTEYKYCPNCGARMQEVKKNG